MAPRVQFDEEQDSYQLGDDVNGRFVAFAVLDGAHVRGLTGDSGAAGASGDYTANDDGTYTRTADGARGRFGPSGFEPSAT